jgi:phage host-nuclease inhibitor protein Gam
LAVLKVLSDNPTLNNYCNTDDLNKIKFETQVLQVYSENALNTNIADVYTEIASLASELSDRQDASQAYCRLKRQNITEATDRALAVFGRRKK